MNFTRYRIFVSSFIITAILIAVKVLFHLFGYEILRLGSLHTGVVTGTFFVVGFLLSTTISDYKESERIPAEVASAVEDMYEDGKSIHGSYPDFDLVAYKKQLRQIARSFSVDVRNKRHSTRMQVYKLNDSFAAMESAKVPPNFIVKLKQQQSQLLRLLARVTYIQRITFIPSARILARSIIPLTLGLLLFTEIEPIVGGMVITAAISFILIYILQLIQVISTPFHSEGKTQDDVSLFLIDETIRHLSRKN